ncbi:helix-turn-helix transcriptional regulator [Streptomyces sp. NPDC001832]|uniref:helix-turn-helix transcriptional regulator n=1 Tax=Streptomyces sp. NPDC001832 TaxID=3154527 RepID=UPI0033312B6F
MSNQNNTLLQAVDVSREIPMYQLVSANLMRTLMQRTGTGAKVTGRQLAADAGIAHGTVGSLLTGAQNSVPESTADAIARRIGVDILVLFVPVGRSTQALSVVPAQAESA